MIILIEDTARRGLSTALSISRAKGNAEEERIRTVIAPETQKTMLLAKKKLMWEEEWLAPVRRFL